MKCTPNCIAVDFGWLEPHGNDNRRSYFCNRSKKRGNRRGEGGEGKINGREYVEEEAEREMKEEREGVAKAKKQ